MNEKPRKWTDADHALFPPLLLSPREVALTGVMSEHAIRKLIKQKKVPVVLIGNKQLVNYTELVKALNRMQAELTPEAIERKRQKEAKRKEKQRKKEHAREVAEYYRNARLKAAERDEQDGQ
ncbi:hypothetical protein EII31_03780 [Leucobacter sp. OH2974_COT-288]|nr:hypothetical protein EII31_03780 [Leucobacter sp. OH2974_COT-288]